MIERLIAGLGRAGLVEPTTQALRRLGLLLPTYRLYERLVALTGRRSRQAITCGQSDGIPVPPADLRVMVGGTADTDWFLSFGELMFATISDMLQRHDMKPSSLTRVLEFGCGCGRVLRQWHGVTGPEIHGSDYNPRMVNWCREHLTFCRIEHNGLAPPLPYPDSVFDFCYAISVFTHLPQDLQQEWMRELSRVLVPGGCLLITVLGEQHVTVLREPERTAFDRQGIFVKHADASGTNLCRVYHGEGYVRSVLSGGFTVLEFLAGGRPGEHWQDVYLLRKDGPCQEDRGVQLALTSPA